MRSSVETAWCNELSIYLSICLSVCLSIYISICLSIYGSTALFGPLPLFQFLNLYTIGTIPWTGDQPVARPLPAHRTAQTQNKRTQTSMPRMRFQPTIPVFERGKTAHALDRAATVIGILLSRGNIFRPRSRLVSTKSVHFCHLLVLFES
jgi:hypothetical protein